MSSTSPTENYQPSKESIADWWKNVLKTPTHIVAPMVDASELAWRMLSRRYNSHLCFTPMIHSKNFVKDPTYRNEYLNSCKCSADRPLIVQFCGNDPNIIQEAAGYVKGYCDGIDINLGCPQKIAKNGHYGAFLMENEWDLITNMVRNINSIGVPVSCKIRVFTDVEKTVRYAKTIEEAGCWMLTVHGRTITQKGIMTGLADWSIIKAVREAVSIPVIANGNIQYLKDVKRCIEATGVNGVMSAEGNLHNPAIFSGLQPFVWDIAKEYIQLTRQYPCPISYTRGHLFKIFHHLLVLDVDLRTALGKGGTLEEFEQITDTLKQRYERFAIGVETWAPPADSPKTTALPFPPWICQPYERPPPSSPLATPRVFGDQREFFADSSDTPPEVESAMKLPSKKSLKRMNKLARVNRRIRDDKKIIQCFNPECFNISGNKCDFNLCKVCCKVKCNDANVDCEGHRIFVKSYIAGFKRKRDVVSSDTTVEIIPVPTDE